MYYFTFMPVLAFAQSSCLTEATGITSTKQNDDMMCFQLDIFYAKQNKNRHTTKKTKTLHIPTLNCFTMKLKIL